MSAFHMKTLDEGAQHHALGESGQGRAVTECMIPEGAMLGIAEAEFKRHAAKNQRQQHHQDGEIDRRQDDGEGQRKGRQQADAAQHQPGLIAVPDGRDGIHLNEERVLVQGVPNQRNQNPNLFRDPRSGRLYLTFYRGNDRDHFEIISKSADSILDLDKAPEKVLLKSDTTVAAPTLLHLKKAKNAEGKRTGIYYLVTEIYPHRYTDNPEGEWQVKVFFGDSPDGDLQPVEGNPVMSGQRACLFQHVFNGRFYGYDCHLDSPDHWILEEVEAPLP